MYHTLYDNSWKEVRTVYPDSSVFVSRSVAAQMVGVREKVAIKDEDPIITDTEHDCIAIEAAEILDNEPLGLVSEAMLAMIEHESALP